MYTAAQNCPLKISLGGHWKPFSHVCQHLKKMSMIVYILRLQNGLTAIFPVFEDDAFHDGSDGSGGGDVAKKFG